MNKKILIITPFCAPESHAAVFRAHKLTKYLKKEGWEPQILTVDTNYIYNEDQALLEELKGIPIHRTRYVEPSLRGLYMWLIGKDRTYKTLKPEEKNTTYNKQQTENKKNIKSDLFNTFYKFLLDHYLRKPDRFWTWKRTAIKKAKKLIEEESIETIYTTMPPYTCGAIGLVLKKYYPQIYWISDFRDPLSTVLRNHSKIDHVYLKQKKIEESVVDKCDKVVTASLSHKNIFHDIFKGKYFDKIHFIPTGLDDEILIRNNTAKEDTIIYTGEYLIENGFYIFKMIYNYNLKSNKKIKLKIIGNKEINKKVITTKLNKRSYLYHVEFIDHLPQKKLYEEIVKAKACLLISEGRWWCSFAKMVDYIALKMPVITLVPEISEAKTQLQNSGLGIFITGDIEKDILLIKTLIDEKSEIIKPNIDFCNKYLASSQTKSFLEVLNKLQ